MGKIIFYYILYYIILNYITLKPANASTSYVKFADDTTFVLSIPYTENPIESIKKEILHVDQWCINHKMALNKDKTKLLYLTGNKDTKALLRMSYDNILAKQIKFLGIHISHNLSWSFHIDIVISTLSARLHLLRILRNVLSKHNLMIVYYAHFQSVLDYNFTLISSFNKKDIYRVNCLIKRAHRVICGPECSSNCLKDFETRCLKLKSNLFQKILNNENHVIFKLVPGQSAFSRRFILPHINSNKMLDSFIISNVINYNKQITRVHLK